MKVHAETRKGRIMSKSEHTIEMGTCPHCGFEYSPGYDYPYGSEPTDNGRYWEIRCPKCKGGFQEWHELVFCGHNVTDDDGDADLKQPTNPVLHDKDCTCEHCRIQAAAPELHESACYFDTAAEGTGFEAAADDELITITVTAKALRDNTAAIAKAEPV